MIRKYKDNTEYTDEKNGLNPSFIHGYQWLSMVINGYQWSSIVIKFSLDTSNLFPFFWITLSGFIP